MPSRKTAIVHKLVDPVYGCRISLVVGNEPQLLKFFNDIPEMDTPIESVDFAGLFVHAEYEEGEQYFILVNTEATTPTKSLEGILIHEIVHLALDVFRSVGIKLSPDSEESFSYYVEYLYTSLTPLLKAPRARSKRKTA